MAVLTVAALRASARAILPRGIFDFVEGGAGDETAARLNRTRLQAVRLSGRVAAGRVEPDTAWSRFGVSAAAPVLIAPTAYHGLVCPEGEIATAAAAQATGIPYVVSTLSTTPFAALAKTGADLLFQLYVQRDPHVTRSLVQEAVQHGCKALVVTVDVPVFGRRWRDHASGFRIPEELATRNKVRRAVAAVDPAATARTEAEFVARNFKDDLSWRDVETLVAVSPVPVIVKGLLHPADVAEAIQAGAAGVIVSNHGGRQLEAHPASIDALPAMVEAARGLVPVLVDGGFASGTDVLRGLALGADGVLIGRQVLWALAVGGAALLERYLREVVVDLGRAMALCGVPALSDAAGLGLATRHPGRREGAPGAYHPPHEA